MTNWLLTKPCGRAVVITSVTVLMPPSEAMVTPPNVCVPAPVVVISSVGLSLKLVGVRTCTT